MPIFIRLCNQAKDLELEPLKVGGSRQTSRVSPGSLPDLRPGVKKTPQPQLALPKSGWSQPDCHSSYNGSTVSKPGSFACTLTTSNTGVTNSFGVELSVVTEEAIEASEEVEMELDASNDCGICSSSSPSPPRLHSTPSMKRF